MVSSIAPPLSSDKHVICQTASGAERQIISVSAAGADVVFVANVRNIVTICLFASESGKMKGLLFCSMAFTSHVKTVSKLFTQENNSSVRRLLALQLTRRYLDMKTLIQIFYFLRR